MEESNLQQQISFLEHPDRNIRSSAAITLGYNLKNASQETQSLGLKSLIQALARETDGSVIADLASSMVLAFEFARLPEKESLAFSLLEKEKQAKENGVEVRPPVIKAFLHTLESLVFEHWIVASRVLSRVSPDALLAFAEENTAVLPPRVSENIRKMASRELAKIQAALVSLAYTADESILPALLLASWHPNESVRYEAAATLGKISEKSSHSLKEKIAQALLLLSADQSHFVAESATTALGSIDNSTIKSAAKSVQAFLSLKIDPESKARNFTKGKSEVPQSGQGKAPLRA